MQLQNHSLSRTGFQEVKHKTEQAIRESNQLERSDTDVIAVVADNLERPSDQISGLTQVMQRMQKVLGGYKKSTQALK